MTLNEFKRDETNHFIAMEYYYLIANRTYLILIVEDQLIGIKANGIISAPNEFSFLFNEITDDLSNPNSYLNPKYLDKVKNLNLVDGSILKNNKENFIIQRSDIKSAIYNPCKKFGMGPYPHDGRVIIKTISNEKREFIILGNQSGKKIAELITQK